MYCICHKISFKDILSLASDYNFDIKNLIKNGICGTKCQLCIKPLMQELKNINPDSVLELEEGKIYYLHFNDPLPSEQLSNLVDSLRLNRVKGVIVFGDVHVENLVDTIKGLPQEYKNIIIDSLSPDFNKLNQELQLCELKDNEINPLAHEQTK